MVSMVHVGNMPVMDKLVPGSPTLWMGRASSVTFGEAMAWVLNPARAVLFRAAPCPQKISACENNLASTLLQGDGGLCLW